MELIEFADEICEGIERVGRTFDDKDDDWIPVMHILPGPSDQMMVIGFDPAFLESAERKDVLANEFMVPLIIGCGASLVGVVFSAWGLVFDQTDKEKAEEEFEKANREGIADNPNRIEMVLMGAMNQTDGLCRSAEIIRDGVNPPQLMEWKKWDDGMIGGRFGEVIQRAMEESDGIPDPEFMQMLTTYKYREGEDEDDS